MLFSDHKESSLFFRYNIKMFLNQKLKVDFLLSYLYTWTDDYQLNMIGRVQNYFNFPIIHNLRKIRAF
jgi:hypothetical protein